MRLLRSTLVLLIVLFALAGPALAHGMAEEIDHLLGVIASSPCAFIRNGVAYDGAHAVDHVRDKYDHYRSDIHSAEDFIRLAASKSMMSGQPYLVRCGQVTVPAADWLTRELARFRAQP